MSRLWFVYQDHAQKGPFTLEEMIHYIRSAGIMPEDLAWTEGMPEWARVDHIGDFYSALKELPGQIDYSQEQATTESSSFLERKSIQETAAEPEPLEPPEPPDKPEPATATPSEPTYPPAQDNLPDSVPAAVSAKTGESETTPAKKSKIKSTIIIAVLAVVIIGGGLLAYNLIADRSEEATDETAVKAVEEVESETVIPADDDETYLIAFDSNHLGTFDLFVCDLSGQRMVRLTESEDDDYSASWSPDGTKILFSRYYIDKYLYSIYILELASGNLTRINDPEGNYSSATWSPDGNRIACAADPTGNYEFELWLMDPDGSNLTQLTELGLYSSAPDWSPDGNKIAFSVGKSFGKSEIYVVDSSGNNLIQLTSSGGFNHYPAWSPDGSKIAFVSDNHDENGYYEIYLMDADGSNKTRLTESDNNSQHPGWSPDGSKIIYSEEFQNTFTYDNIPSLYIMNSDGSNPIRITEGLSFEERASWSPLKLNINNLGDVIQKDALDPDFLLGNWQGEYEGIIIEYTFSDERMELILSDETSRVEFRARPYFSILNLEVYNSFFEQWDNYGQVDIIDQDNIIIRDAYLSSTFSDDYMKSYIEVHCVRIADEAIQSSLDADYHIDFENGTISLSDLPIGSRIVDLTWQWEFRKGYNYTNEGAYGLPTDLGENKPVSWIVVAKDHYDLDEPHVTILAEELIGRHTFDDSTHANKRGSNHWGDSGTHSSAEYGLRPWLNSSGIPEGAGFYQAFSSDFKNAILTTSLPNHDGPNDTKYFTNDKVFIPSTTELGDTGHESSYEIGTAYAYFAGSSPEQRAAHLDNSFEEYWTRSPYKGLFSDNHTLTIIKEDGEFGSYLPSNFAWLGIRPVINLDAGTMVSEVDN